MVMKVEKKVITMSMKKMKMKVQGVLKRDSLRRLLKQTKRQEGRQNQD